MLDVYDGLALSAMALHVLVSPFSKVEESFNTQALHDLAVLPLSRLEDFDHRSFPGVVPRTFLGAALLTVLALPLRPLLAPLTAHCPTLLHLQVMYRLLLGTVSVLSLGQLRRASVAKFGARPGRLMMAVFALGQFHLPFYCSRLLPNSYGLLACSVAHAQWLRVCSMIAPLASPMTHLQGRPYQALGILVAGTVVFRCDLLVLLAPLALQMLLAGEVLPAPRSRTVDVTWLR